MTIGHGIGVDRGKWWSSFRVNFFLEINMGTRALYVFISLLVSVPGSLLVMLVVTLINKIACHEFW